MGMLFYRWRKNGCLPGGAIIVLGVQKRASASKPQADPALMKTSNKIDLIDIAATSGWSLSVKLSDKFSPIMFTGESLEI
jgi:hypothetical protein